MRGAGGARAEGIDLTGLTTVDGPTGVALILVDAGGENLIAVASGANAGARPPSVVGAALEPARRRRRATSSSSATRSRRTPRSPRSAAARAAGATTILNPAPATGLDGRGPRLRRHRDPEPRRAPPAVRGGARRTTRGVRRGPGRERRARSSPARRRPRPAGDRRDARSGAGRSSSRRTESRSSCSAAERRGRRRGRSGGHLRWSARRGARRGPGSRDVGATRGRGRVAVRPRRPGARGGMPTADELERFLSS